ncbi:hypothetical protein EDB87DRAFT_1630853 [Lactarius vividus]|nr:hypothetical protein EDB87DRAFT_1630853 [Lactarius vividus]
MQCQDYRMVIASGHGASAVPFCLISLLTQLTSVRSHLLSHCMSSRCFQCRVCSISLTPSIPYLWRLFSVTGLILGFFVYFHY